MEKESSEKVEEKDPFSAELNEFDFDSQPDKPTKKFTLKRAPARQQPKKVARMDKVFNDIRKYQKMDEAAKKS